MDGRRCPPENAYLCIGKWDCFYPYVNEINVAAKSHSLEPMWIRLKNVDREQPSLFLDSSVLGTLNANASQIEVSSTSTGRCSNHEFQQEIPKTCPILEK